MTCPALCNNLSIRHRRRISPLHLNAVLKYQIAIAKQIIYTIPFKRQSLLPGMLEKLMERKPGEDYLSALDRNGFVVAKSVLSEAKLEALRDASSKAVELARNGGWPHIRTVGKQFPPWESTPGNGGIWGVQHLMKPELPGHELFTETYFSEEILGIVKNLLQCEDEHLVMELFNMLVRPGKDFELRWHRDDISNTATPEEELTRLQQPAWHAQYNLALWGDDSLILVPGSHKRARTHLERQAEPFEPNLPGQLIVELGPGDIAFYNNNILHRGVYDCQKERMTLHGSVGHVKGGQFRARNVLQHGMRDWIEHCDVAEIGGKEGRRAESMRNELIKLGSQNGIEMGYSHQD